MTVQSTTQRNDYTGNGSTSAYSYAFRITQASDLLVTVADTSTPPVETVLALTTDYTLSGIGASAGGTVTLVNASQAWLTSGNLKSNYHITVRRNPLFEQLTSIRNLGSFYPGDLEDAIDYVVMQTQALKDLVGQSLRLRETSTATPPVWPDFGSALQSIRINAAGTALEYFNPNAAGNIAYSPPGTGFGQGLTVQSVMDALNTRVHGSRAIPTAITTGGISSDSGCLEQIWFIKGNGGAIDLTAVSPQITAGTIVGQKIRIIGCDDTNTVTVGNGFGLISNGVRVIHDGTVLEYTWGGGLWEESYFNNI